MAAEQINLKNGPSKFDLMAALFVKNPNGQYVEFMRDDGRVFRASIIGVGLEDGSGESWLIEGYARPDEVGVEVDTSNPQTEGRGSRHYFHGYFTTARRIGHIKFERRSQ